MVVVRHFRGHRFLDRGLSLARDSISASAIMPAVQRMLDNPGVYITGAVNATEATIVIVSIAGKLFSTVLDRELAPDRFLDGFIIKSGPHQ